MTEEAKPSDGSTTINVGSVGLRFRKSQHLRKPVEFERVYDTKIRASDAHLLIFGAANELGWSRIGLSVSRKQGNAVVRARLKRLLREAFRQKQHELPKSFDFILIPRAYSGAMIEDYRRSVRALCAKIARRFEQNVDSSGTK